MQLKEIDANVGDFIRFCDEIWLVFTRLGWEQMTEKQMAEAQAQVSHSLE